MPAVLVTGPTVMQNSPFLLDFKTLAYLRNNRACHGRDSNPTTASRETRVFTTRCCCRFEKSFAGHYIGDLARLVMLRLVNEQLLFGGEKSKKLLQWKSFTAQHLSDIERFVTVIHASDSCSMCDYARIINFHIIIIIIIIIFAPGSIDPRGLKQKSLKTNVEWL